MEVQTQSETLPPISLAKLKVNDMVCSFVSDVKPLNYALPSLEHIPLAQRRKLLNSRSAESHSSTLQNDSRIPLTRKPTLDAVVRKEHEDFESQVTCSTFKTDASGVDKTSVNVSILARCPTLSVYDGRATIKVENYEIPSSSADKGRKTSLQLDSPIAKVKKEIPQGNVDDVDHMVLKERLRMLLARKLPGLSNTTFEGSNNTGLSENIMEQTDKNVNEEIYSADGKTTVARDQCDDTQEGSSTSLFKLPFGPTFGSPLSTDYASSKSTVSVNTAGLQEDDHMLKSGGIISHCDSHVEQNVMPINSDGPSSLTSPTFVKVKDEPSDYSENHNVNEDAMGSLSIKFPDSHNASSKSTASVISVGLQEDDHILKSGGIITQLDSHVEQNVMPINSDGQSSSTSPTFVKVKDEPWDYSENHNVNKDAMGNLSINFPNVKSEWEVHTEYLDDQAEHMSLIDRLNFLMAGEDSSVNISTSYSSLKKTKLSSFISSSIYSKSAEPLSINCRRKRKKTATDSVQTALEEDAPGLLQVLLDKGVLVDEIKLYGENEDDEAVDESFCEDSFSELEAVMTKIFSQRHSFFKFPLTHASKTSRANYCLACLISLVEQTRYLKFRKWPVEWGWCRDLQSFIFVFERHSRLVLERPEYGYATYFFELVESLPVEWQIKRLVIAMKLTNCSRISLIENKELLVGEDLTEGEAKVLMEYGWTPNSGLGTMLNYRDRVVHDRRNEKDSSEWRSKIGKMLMDGYNGGTIVTPNIPKKVKEYVCAQSPDISSCSSMSDQ